MPRNAHEEPQYAEGTTGECVAVIATTEESDAPFGPRLGWRHTPVLRIRRTHMCWVDGVELPVGLPACTKNKQNLTTTYQWEESVPTKHSSTTRL